jgi:hypothetical protein
VIALGFVVAVGLPLAVIALAILWPERQAEDMRPPSDPHGVTRKAATPRRKARNPARTSLNPQVKKWFGRAVRSFAQVAQLAEAADLR